MESFGSILLLMYFIATLFGSLILFVIIYAAVKPKRRDRIQMQNQQLLGIIVKNSYPDQSTPDNYSKMDMDEVRKEFIVFKAGIFKPLIPFLLSIVVLLVIVIVIMAVFLNKAS